MIFECWICKSKAFLKYRGTVSARDFFGAKNKYAIAEGGREEKLDVYACSACGLGFSPLDGVTGEDVKAFYTDQPVDSQYVQEEAGRRKSFQKVLQRIEELRLQRGNILDYGAAAGIFLDEARKAGWKIYGTEPGAGAREYAEKNFGISLLEDRELAELPDEFFDVVTLFDVIEHVADPAETVRMLARKLKKGGLLVMTTPRFESLTRKILGTRWYFMFPAHLWYFTRDALGRMLRESGFGNAQFRVHVFHFSFSYLLKRFSSLFLPAVSRTSGVISGKKDSFRIIVPVCFGEEWEVYARKE